MSLPFVSVVMPVFDCAHYVAEAVASVRAQAWPELELIAVDDGSTDHTPEILEALAADRANRMRVVRTTNQGPAAARNHALGLVRGPFIAFIDADDLWPEDKLEVQLGRFRLQPELEIVLGLVAVQGLQGCEGSTRRFDPIGTPVIAANIGSGVFAPRHSTASAASTKACGSARMSTGTVARSRRACPSCCSTARR